MLEINYVEFASKLSKNLNDFNRGKNVLHCYILEVATEANVNILSQNLKFDPYDIIPD